MSAGSSHQADSGQANGGQTDVGRADAGKAEAGAPVQMSPTAYDAVRDAARRYDYDRYLAALLSPRSVRQDLVALASVTGAVERVPSLVNEPMMGEIRLQWWADWAEKVAAQPDHVSGNPIADAAGAAIARHRLSVTPLAVLFKARLNDLYADPFESDADYAAYAADCEAGPFELAASALGLSREPSPKAVAVIEAAGRCWGGVRVLWKLAFFASRGRWPLPVDHSEGASFLDGPDASTLNDHTRRLIVEREFKAIRTEKKRVLNILQ
ncbi:MAG: squalene/phytoene synthase family protein, partial [Pseudomonadota bacterium]